MKDVLTETMHWTDQDKERETQTKSGSERDINRGRRVGEQDWIVSSDGWREALLENLIIARRCWTGLGHVGNGGKMWSGKSWGENE